jgi:hypothetical protein
MSNMGFGKPNSERRRLGELLSELDSMHNNSLYYDITNIYYYIIL